MDPVLNNHHSRQNSLVFMNAIDLIIVSICLQSRAYKFHPNFLLLYFQHIIPNYKYKTQQTSIHSKYIMYPGFACFGVKDQRAMQRVNQQARGNFYPPLGNFRPQGPPRHSYPAYAQQQRTGRGGMIKRELRPPGFPF